MNLYVLGAVLLGFAGLWLVNRRFYQLNTLSWLTAGWVGIYLCLRFAVDPPLPASIRVMFLFITTLGMLVYLTSDSRRLEETGRLMEAFVTAKRYRVALLATVVLLPVLVAWRVYADVTRPPQPPITSRTIHPPPPGQITFAGATINLTTADNPYRPLEGSDPDAFAAHVENGRRVYHQNCVYCHGDDMAGDGLFAHGFDPIPANFQDATTIAMLQESYLFWRIAKGGPGLPAEATPWASAMPAWESILTEEEIWDVILFLYDYTGYRPRAREELH